MNTPARLLSVLVENKPGVLQRVASMIRRRGFNIDSLSVGPTDDGSVSRMTITVHVGRQQAEQAMKQLYKLVDVIKIDDITTERVVAQELVLIKLNAPPRSRRELLDLISMFDGRVVDVASTTLIVELTGPAERIDDFIGLVQPYGIKEIARSGAVAMVRGNTARLRLVEREHESEAEHEPVAPAPRAKVSAIAADVTGDI
ncbi:MAG: acetolactate synthase small subunit [Candidatus Dormibacteria bacterium]